MAEKYPIVTIEFKPNALPVWTFTNCEVMSPGKFEQALMRGHEELRRHHIGARRQEKVLEQEKIALDEAKRTELEQETIDAAKQLTEAKDRVQTLNANKTMV